MAEVQVVMPLDSLRANSNSPAQLSRSILSRFSSPLSKHARNLFDLAIETDDPFKVYTPGEIVQGHVVLTVLKGFDITHLVVALHGCAKVFKHQNTGADGVVPSELPSLGKGTRDFEYHGNGFATLFQTERVLCGDGFLKKSIYKFAFELTFPSRSMPSTLTFERGLVTYMITATLTRPTPIAPTTTQYTTINFSDSIDIVTLSSPKTRVISLEPINKRGKVKVVKGTASSAASDGTQRVRLTRLDTQSSTTSRSAINFEQAPLSPTPSTNTFTTTVSTSTRSHHPADDSSPDRRSSPHDSEARSSITSTSSKTITASAQLTRHGALPGDTMPIRVTVSHTKPNVRGVVIATLYRSGRVDMHPPLPLASKGKTKKAEYEDVYPRSKSGLGGLYFSTGAPNSVFRKDLSQSSTMMVIDPQTLTADITTSIKIPDTAFPTIANVPGGMISFTYHVEVVVDLFGKLGENRLLPRLTSSEPTFTHTTDGGNQLNSEWTNTILDTSQLRRTKSVLTFEMSLIIGTKDTGRRKKPSREVVAEHGAGYDQNQYHQGWQEYDYNQGYDPHDPYAYGEGEYGYGEYDGYDGYGGQYDGYDPSQDPPPADLIPPPPPEEHVDEKTRLRRQEELLLPSRPPAEAGPSRSGPQYAPTAPVFPPMNGTHDQRHIDDGRLSPRTSHTEGSVLSTRSADTVTGHPRSPPPPPTESDGHTKTDDKQEMERRRLMAQASAPPVDDVVVGSSSRPTAPMITDETYNVQTLFNEHHEPDLPEYQR